MLQCQSGMAMAYINIIKIREKVCLVCSQTRLTERWGLPYAAVCKYAVNSMHWEGNFTRRQSVQGGKWILVLQAWICVEGSYRFAKLSWGAAHSMKQSLKATSQRFSLNEGHFIRDIYSKCYSSSCHHCSHCYVEEFLLNSTGKIIKANFALLNESFGLIGQGFL